jgi:hypothetical protein
MTPPTRRRLLRTVAAAAVGTAGCGRLLGDESSSSRSVSERSGGTLPGGTTETDPDTVSLRGDTDGHPIRLGDPSGTPAASARRGRRPTRSSHAVIDTRSRARRLTVADGVDADAVSSFRSATAFGSETLYLETKPVEACFRLRLCGISWTPTAVRTAYVRQRRPYDARCSADEDVFESRLVRIPDGLRRDDVDSYGSSTSERGRCDGDGPAGVGRPGPDAATGISPTDARREGTE